MKGKVIKVDTGWILMVDNKIYASHNDILSIKNCQVIEYGYDLDELAHHNSLSYTWLEFNERDKTLISKYGIEAFKAGFQKAVELMGDKKFSEKDVRLMLIDMARFIATKELRDDWDLDVDAFFRKRDFFIDKQIQSLQQTEWDVEIEMENYEPLYGMGSTPRPKLDADGCLILKRI